MEKSRLWYLEKFDLFQSMSGEEIEALEQAAFTRKLPKNSVLRFPEMMNKYVYFLKEGVVKIAVMSETGKEFIKYLIKPGNLFGEILLLSNLESIEEYAVAVEDSLICFIDAEKMKQWMNENKELRTIVNKQIGNRIRNVENRLLSMIFKDARARITDFVAEFVQEFGQKTDNGYEVKNFLTHNDIAELTATSRQTVSTILNELRNQGLIDYNTRVIRIPNSSKLLSLIEERN